ncbi:MAG: hypothetical protein DIU68_010190 [Chloroflexota bacterium]|nr:MAG: hypothetical protein DIU68_05925 [Chloroflexota bacterium]
MVAKDFEMAYPDVLGALTDGLRTDLEHLQCALGVFPRQAFINQPLELVLLLQNMIDQPLQVKVTLQLPMQDRRGMLLVLEGPGPVIEQPMGPGEVGVLRMPIIAYPPSQPGVNIPARVTINSRSGRSGRPVRPRGGAARPGYLSMSPLKLQALREVTFNTIYKPVLPDTLTTFFDLAPTRLSPALYSLTARYETIWSPQDLINEREQLENKRQLAAELAGAMTTTAVYWPFYYRTEEVFARRGIRLAPGEIKAITKLMAYTIGEASLYERDQEMHQSRWFRALCAAVIANETVAADQEPGEIAANSLYEAVLADAVALGLEIVRSYLGDSVMPAENPQVYAERVAAWVTGADGESLRYLYLPLVMAGIALTPLVGSSIENPWIMVRELAETVEARKLTAGEADLQVLNWAEQLLRQTNNVLRRLGYLRPQ